MKNVALLLLLGVCLPLGGHAQLFFQNTMYRYNRFVYNPAAAGVPQPGMEAGINLTMMGRQQWAGIEGAPRTPVLFANGKLPNRIGAIGAVFAADQLANWTASRAEVAYAYQFELGTSLRLNIGASGGIQQVLLSGDGWVYNILREGIDPVVPTVTQGTMVATLAAGVYLSSVDENGREGKFFVGLSGQNLLEPSIDAALGFNGGTDGFSSTIPRSFALMGGYRFDLSDRASLTPTVMIQADRDWPPQASVSLFWDYKPISVGVNYRLHQESFGGILGFNVSDRMFLAYSYDYTLNRLNIAGDVGSHELIISYTFPSATGVPGREVDIIDPSNKP